jgi:hypothetical protein
MADYEDRDPWDPMPPRILKSLANLPNYVQDNREMTVDGRKYIFKIDDWRQAHGTTTNLRGYESDDVEMYGFAILLSENKVLLEVWNDSEINCWAEFDLSSGSQIFLRIDEVEPYMSRYVTEKAVIDDYLQEIETEYSTEAMRYCHYYFESDKDEDLMKLKSLEGRSLARRLRGVRKEAEQHFERDDRDGTWRGVCILELALDRIFKGSEFESSLWAETDLIGNTALAWGGKRQKWYIRQARKHIPFIASLYEKTDEEFRKSELWAIMLHQLLYSMMFRNWVGQGEDDIENLSWISRRGERNGGKDAEIVAVFLAKLLKTDLPTRRERKYIKSLIRRNR